MSSQFPVPEYHNKKYNYIQFVKLFKMMEMETNKTTRNMLLKYCIDCFLIMLAANHSMNNE